MKKIISILLIVVMTLSSLSYAQDTPVISPLKKGQPAPYVGVLLSSEAAAQIVAEMESSPEKLRIEVDAAVRTVEAKKDFKINEIISQCKTDKDVLQAGIDTQKAQADIFQKKIKELEEDAPNKPLIFGVGFVGGVLFTLATVFAVSYIAK